MGHHNVWSLLGQGVLEKLSASPALPSFSKSRGATTTHLLCIPPKPCSKKGQKLHATDSQMGKGLWTPGYNYWYKVITTLYEELLWLTVPALGFCPSSLHKVVITAAEEGILLKSTYIECSLLSQERVNLTPLEKGILCFRGSRKGSRVHIPFSGQCHKCHQPFLWPRASVSF